MLVTPVTHTAKVYGLLLGMLPTSVTHTAEIYGLCSACS